MAPWTCPVYLTTKDAKDAFFSGLAEVAIDEARSNCSAKPESSESRNLNHKLAHLLPIYTPKNQLTFPEGRDAMNGIIDNVRKTTESSVALQQELFRKWVSLWPGAPVSVIPFGELQKFQKKWVEMLGELFQRENDTLAVQLKMGFGAVEKLFRLTEAKDPEQLRTKTEEFWQKTFDDLRLISETQMHSLQNAVAKLTEAPNKECKPANQPVRIPAAKETKPRAVGTFKPPVKVKSDKEELKEALEEYEMTRGDWSKGR
jgi:hypothetical protein